ncbi:MAG: primosomal protein N' [Lachnospiraceae bacterium]|nr:primosomal protein N' [Lachnospiraceae bacterium]
MYADIIVDISYEKLDRIFQYRIPEHLREQLVVGSQVEIPFGMGNRVISGYIVGFSESTDYPEEKIKEITGISPGSRRIESDFIRLAAWMRSIYGGTMNQALKTVIPVKREMKGKEKKWILPLPQNEQILEGLGKKSPVKQKLLRLLREKEAISLEEAEAAYQISPAVVRQMKEKNMIQLVSEELYRNPAIYQKERQGKETILTPSQQEIADDFLKEYQSGRRNTSLLFGVTGSGKTEVYMKIIDGVIAQGRQAIVLIPEIALTYQTMRRFYEHFGERASIVNSKMSMGERSDQFARAERGEIDIMIGPRSALFTPFKRLGLIVIDEEHEGSYKSETVPKYHARETAQELARMKGAEVLLGSATPSVESFQKAVSGEYRLYELKERVKGRTLPAVEIVDLREELKQGNRTMFSRSLRGKMEQRLKKGEQMMLFLNRRGYGGFVSCRSCGEAMRCPHCDVGLTAHKDGTLHCHYCGYTIKLPEICPKCGSPYIGVFGTGTQRLEEAVKREFPQARLLRMDMDTTRTKDSYEKILSSFGRGEADILIGTQMIVKGHDFPGVTLVGIVAADMSLFASDYRSSERTFELLTQAAGRAGRGDTPGEVVIQTYNPEHYSIRMAAGQDYRGFYEEELMYRKLLKYPPCGKLMAVLITSKEENRAQGLAQELAELTQNLCGKDSMEMLGPTKAGISRMKDIYRFVIYYKEAERGNSIEEAKKRLEDYLELYKDRWDCMVQFDFNPMTGY